MDKMRAKFEMYAASQGYHDFEIDHYDSDRYRNPNMQGRWNFWQAALDCQALASSATAFPSAMTYVGSLSLGCVDGEELSAWDIEPDNKAIDALQLKLVRTSKDVHMCLFAVPVDAAAALAKQVPAQEQDKIDAQRYRWLREQAGSFQGPEVWIDGNYRLGTAMDAAIDAAQLAQSADTAEGDHD
jgi:hypothetical protein